MCVCVCLAGACESTEKLLPHLTCTKAKEKEREGERERHFSNERLIDFVGYNSRMIQKLEDGIIHRLPPGVRPIIVSGYVSAFQVLYLVTFNESQVIRVPSKI